MLKKLFKYEWKAFWKVPATINIFLLIITALGVISLLSPLWRLDSDIMGPLAVLALMFYYLAIFAGSIAVSVYIAIRFYKNVYTDEGYLTHTLPVTPRSIILSKLFVGTIWTFITAITIVVSVFALFMSVISIENINFFEEMKTVWSYFGYFIRHYLNMNVIVFIVFTVLYMILSTFFSIIMMYASVALGQLFTKHKVMGAIIWYIAIYALIQTISSLFINAPLFAQMAALPSINLDVGSYIKPIFVISAIFTLILSAVLFFITEYMMKKKLNLE